jgi:transcriptional regulator with AAA-type ATPase domain
MATRHLGSPRRRLAGLFRALDLYKRLGIDAKYEKTQALINQADTFTGRSRGKKVVTDETNKIVTANKPLKKVIAQVAQAAKSEIPVLLVGKPEPVKTCWPDIITPIPGDRENSSRSTAPLFPTP